MQSAQTRRASLGGALAQRTRIRYTCGTPAVVFVVDSTVALSADRSKVSVTLYASEKKYGRDQRVLSALLRTWQFLQR